MIQLLHRTLGALRRRSFEKRFARHEEGGYGGNLYRGVYPTFAAAQQSAPPSKPTGYDNAASADLYLDRTKRVYPADYPVLFWLEKLFLSGRKSVFDLGGHIGVAYYAYRKYLTYPASLRWVVHDVPAVMARGRELATRLDSHKALSFADSTRDATGFDVFFASGSLQYLPVTLGEILNELPQRPRHVLVNLTPLHPSESFFTLQSIATSYCPYRVTQFGRFVEELGKVGYRQRDVWENPDKRCEIAFDPAHSLDRYYGGLFDLE